MQSIRIQQQARQPDQDTLDKCTNWIMLIVESATDKTLSVLPCHTVLKEKLIRAGNKKATNKVFTLDLPNKQASHLSFTRVRKDTTEFELLSLARKLVDPHTRQQAKEIGIVVTGFAKKESERVAEAVIAAALARAAKMPSFKSKQDKQPSLEKLHLHGLKTTHGFKRTLAESEGNALARSLSMLPPNKLTPADYLKKVKVLAREKKWKLDFYGVPELKKKKAGAFLAVCQGSPTQDAGIVRLQYKPSTKSKKGTLTLVGKGICYDTGGVSLKPPKYMFGMHEDMQGSAVALGTFLALTELKVNFPVECWLALAMNHIGPKSYIPNDVVTASDGTTIEVVNTDAEGRMVLADTLALASKLKPKVIMDYATLTGACMLALGTSYSGIFTNNEALMQKLIDAGRDSGERVWPFPRDEDYDKIIESQIADVKQCGQEGMADHIQAARFLGHFIKNDVTWIHVDLSSSNRKGGLAHIPTDTTGFGVRYSLNLVLDKKVL